MSNQYLKLRRSAVPGRIPDTASLQLGEIALNTYDGKAFMKKSGSEGEQIYTPGSNSIKKESSISNLVESLKNSGIVQFLASIIVSILLIWVIKKAFFKKKDSGSSISSSSSSSSGGGGGG